MTGHQISTEQVNDVTGRVRRTCLWCNQYEEADNPQEFPAEFLGGAPCSAAPTDMVDR